MRRFIGIDRSTNRSSARALLGTALCAAALLGCGKDPAAPAENAEPIRPRSSPIEFVGLTLERPIDVEGFEAFTSPIFGAQALAGTRHQNYELEPGILLSVSEDPRTRDQVVVSLDMLPSRVESPTRRTVLRVPVSFAYGQVFIDTVKAALTRADALYATSPTSTYPFELEYRVLSANGGSLILHVEWAEGRSLLRVITEDPRTSLVAGDVNRPAFTGEPYETVAGTVNFELSRDEFDFFSSRAYGFTGGAAQNFRDFQLLPHNWLRLTVTPRLADEMVDVGFEVITLDGRRVPFARAPASFLAGDQFRENVFRLVDNMLAQEARAPGSSTPWTTPFHYDDPEGGGVVKVIAKGRAGRFTIAYAVESPIRRLREVDFVPYVAELDIPSELPPPVGSCEERGTTTSLRGKFKVKFDASPTVRQSISLDAPLRGNIWGSVYRAEDVQITGPNAGAVAVADFHFEDVDLTNPASLREYVIDTEISAGQYQILGFMDNDGNAVLETPDPDVNDPVTLPIGNYTMGCAEERVTVEFALTLPAGR